MGTKAVSVATEDKLKLLINGMSFAANIAPFAEFRSCGDNCHLFILASAHGLIHRRTVKARLLLSACNRQ